MKTKRILFTVFVVLTIVLLSASAFVACDSKQMPEISLTAKNVAQESFGFALSVTDPDRTGHFVKMELVRDGSVKEMYNFATDRIDNLLSDNDYTLKLYYNYDLKNGKGEQTLVKELNVHTLAKTTPTVVLVENDVGQESFGFTATITDPDGTGHICKLELIHGSETKNIEDLTTDSFNGLLSGHDYTVKLYYEYDLNDGSGVHMADASLTVHTRAKTEPRVELAEKDVTRDGFGFTLTVTDPDKTGRIAKMELVRGETVQTVADLDADSFDGLLPDCDYVLIVYYDFDLNNGGGVQTLETKLSVHTLA